MNTTRDESAFLALIQKTRFGTIENFRLSGGRPIIDANTEVTTEFKFSGVQPVIEVVAEEQYLARPQVRAMIERFRDLGDGMVECLDVREGLPFKMRVRRRA